MKTLVRFLLSLTLGSLTGITLGVIVFIGGSLVFKCSGSDCLVAALAGYQYALLAFILGTVTFTFFSYKFVFPNKKQ